MSECNTSDFKLLKSLEQCFNYFFFKSATKIDELYIDGFNKKISIQLRKNIAIQKKFIIGQTSKIACTQK